MITADYFLNSVCYTLHNAELFQWYLFHGFGGFFEVQFSRNTIVSKLRFILKKVYYPLQITSIFNEQNLINPKLKA